LPDPCALVTQAEVEQATNFRLSGQDGPEDDDDSVLGVGRACQFLLASAGMVRIGVHADPGATARAQFEAAGQVEAVAGIGDEAFLFEGSSLNIRAHGYWLDVYYDWAVEDERRDALLVLGRAAVGRLPS
jgi:hypothetical protein